MLSSGLSSNLHAAPIFTPTDASKGSTQAASSVHSRTYHSKSSRVCLRDYDKLEKDFFGSAMVIEHAKSPQYRKNKTKCNPQAVIAAPVENSQEHVLDGGLQLKVKAMAAGKGSRAIIEFQIGNCYLDSPLLHWGLTQPGSRKWKLPSTYPEGSREFQNQAIQTPFRKTGDIATLAVEIHETKFDAIEFIVKDDSKNLWLKFQGGNFRVLIPELTTDLSSVVVPEDLVQIQSYLRWERSGKQDYSIEQQKEEYEKARRELQEEVANGTSLDALKARLLKGEGSGSSNGTAADNASVSSPELPDELIQVQSFVRWEKAGKPNYTAEEQLKEFEAARKDLENEILGGASIKDIYKRLKVDPETLKKGKGTAKPKKKQLLSIQRKKRDFGDLINSYKESENIDFTPARSSIQQTPLELAAERVSKGETLQKMLFKLGGGNLLVLATIQGESIHICFASDVREPLILHWGVSKLSNGEWQCPPDTIIPPNSTALEGFCETVFGDGFAGESSFQALEITIQDSGIIGIPFVLRSGESWIKNSGSDFYISVEAVKKPKKDLGGGEGTAKWMLDEIASSESDAERSLMHRFNIAANLVSNAKNKGQLPLVGILVWMRFMATRQLTWNKNYNVKPREISAAQDRLTSLLEGIFQEQPSAKELIRMILSTVGRGGQGDVGQRIRDEILVVQRKNDCKGGMMEEWHQKLHNNTSPDDVVICQALLDYIKSDLDISVYWETLNSNGVTKERLKSYDRPIVSEPRFRLDQKEGLIRDLTAYLKTLKAVHSGADLESAIASCLGYSSQGEGFMGGVKINPVSGLSSSLPMLLEFVLDNVEAKNVIPLLEGLIESRWELQPTIMKPHSRLRDIIFLDLALDSTVRTSVERTLEGLNNASAKDIVYMITMVLENLCLSSSNNEELVYCLKEWSSVLEACKGNHEQWPLRAKAVLDRTRLVLADKAEYYLKLLQPSAEYLGSLLGVEQWAIDIFTEEVIRSGSAASLSLLLNRIDPILRAAANLGSWQVISPVEVSGYVEVVSDLGDVQDKVYSKPTILVANKVKGEEEIPDGAVAVLTKDMPDVLSHVSVRARNGKICFATCFDMEVFGDLQSKRGLFLTLQPHSSGITYSETTGSDVLNADANSGSIDESLPGISLKKKTFRGKYAISADEFDADFVGAKSRNIANLKSKLPSWIKVPTSVAIPFGVFEKVLEDDRNKDASNEISRLEDSLNKGDLSKLHEIRSVILGLQAPPNLVDDLRSVMKQSNMPWPGDEGEPRWESAWSAIKKVWASKWNERAYISTRKARIDHNDLCMAVLVQEIVRADYAFVIHTTNPSNEDPSEIYAEIVKGLGETLVGAYAGRALSFVTKKTDIQNPQITGFPSKRIGLFIKQSVIFRSDSNGEDLEGYAGAGLYDSVPMDEEEQRVVDYSIDPLVVDNNFQRSILSKIAEAGQAVEQLLGTAQDIEGVIKDGELYLVQTRPQM